MILNLTIYVRDVHTGQLITAMNADFRGNTDESWSRATSYLVRNRLLAPNYGKPQPDELRIIQAFSRAACQRR